MTFETTPQWTGLLLDIEGHLGRLEVGLMIIIREQAALCEEGVYPAVPTLFWDRDPNGEEKYAKLSFPVGALPDGRRKLYIGCKERKIRAAKAKIARTQRLEQLEHERERLDRFLRMTRADLDRVARQVAGYRVPDDLGLDLVPGQAPAGPKTGLVAVELEIGGEWVRARPKVEYDVETMLVHCCMCGHDFEMPRWQFEVDVEEEGDEVEFTCPACSKPGPFEEVFVG